MHAAVITQRINADIAYKSHVRYQSHADRRWEPDTPLARTANIQLVRWAVTRQTETALSTKSVDTELGITELSRGEQIETIAAIRSHVPSRHVTELSHLDRTAGATSIEQRVSSPPCNEELRDRPDSNGASSRDIDAEPRCD